MKSNRDDKTLLNELGISDDFLKENKFNLLQSTPFKKSGPWTKYDKEARRKEVYRLHFDYSWSARQIAELMSVQRNTINSDLKYWYSKIAESNNIFDPETSILVIIERLKIQRFRLRELLDKTDSTKDKIHIERLMSDIDFKINYTHHRLAESSWRKLDSETERLNDWMKDNRKETRFLTLFDIIKVSSNAHGKITKMIEEDRKKGDPDFN